MRYTDEGETSELCKWTVDLSSLPTFRQNASTPGAAGFYAGVLSTMLCFTCRNTDIILQNLNSAEVRGILLYNDQEWERFVFASLGSGDLFLMLEYCRVMFDILA